MTLPEIVLPKVVLPFDIPILLHPIVIHFIIALPIIVLLLELVNLIIKKKAVGGVSFFLLLLTLVAAIGAYFTGLTDAKEAYSTLGEAAKEDLVNHKLLGAYVLLGSGVIFLLKLLSMTGNKALKALYVLALIAFVVLLFKQGKEGGELVYEHGLNVEQVETLNDNISDLKDDLENAKKEVTKLKALEAKKEVSTPIPPSPLKSTGVETIQNEVPAQ